MDEKEYKAIKAKIAYQNYLINLPKCVECDNCMTVTDRKAVKRVCLDTHMIIDNRNGTCPRWCPKIN